MKWRAFAVAVAVAALTILDLSKLNVGLPSIEDSLDAGPTELQVILAGYTLAFGLTLVPAGRLGDIYSRKLMFVIGLSGFTAASLGCALAPDITVLIVARIVQGLAAGILMPQVLGLIQQLFQGPERGRAFGVFGATIGVSTAFAPALGGLLIAVGGDEQGWRLLFWMNVPLGIVALIAAALVLPNATREPGRNTDLDLVGVLILGVATFSLLFPFVTTTGSGDDDPLRWLWLIAAAAAAFGFFRWERSYKRRGRSPVVHFDLFQLSSYRNGLLLATSYFAALPAIFLLSTLFLQEGLGLLPVYAGLVSVPFALSSAVSAWIGGRLVDRIGRPLVIVGLIGVILGYTLDLILAITLPPEVAAYGMAAALLVAGAGGGLVLAPNQTLTLAEIPLAEGGVAGSMTQLGQRIGTAVGVAAGSSTFFATLTREAGVVMPIDAYQDAFRNGVLIAIGLMAVALVIAVLDLRGRRRIAR